jgi:hypothetical protein
VLIAAQSHIRYPRRDAGPLAFRQVVTVLMDTPQRD